MFHPFIKFGTCSAMPLDRCENRSGGSLQQLGNPVSEGCNPSRINNDRQADPDKGPSVLQFLGQWRKQSLILTLPVPGRISTLGTASPLQSLLWNSECARPAPKKATFTGPARNHILPTTPASTLNPYKGELSAHGRGRVAPFQHAAPLSCGPTIILLGAVL